MDSQQQPCTTALAYVSIRQHTSAYALLIWRRDLGEIGEMALVAMPLQHVVAGIAQEVVAGFAGLAAHLLRQHMYAGTSKTSRRLCRASSAPSASAFVRLYQ